MKQGIKALTQRDGNIISSLTITAQSILYICILESIVFDPKGYVDIGIWIFPPTCIQRVFHFCGCMAFYLWNRILEKEYNPYIRLGGLLFCNEFIHTFACCKTRKPSYDVSLLAKLLMRQLAGMIILSFGVWYLGFGSSWALRFQGEELHHASNSSRAIITGLQVRLRLKCTLLTVDWSRRSVHAIDPSHRNGSSKQKRSSLW
jgi:hypothetical protein